MASLNKTYTLFAFTSPRTIEKIIPEIKLLTNAFGDKVWDKQTQEEFYDALFDADFFEGTNKAKNKNLAARDRITRAPKALGFVNLKPVIRLTEAGEKLLTGKRVHETITRQLLKFQLPSPYHTDYDHRFFVKPYLELLRLIRDMNGLTKTEIALYYTQLTHIDRYADVQKRIRIYRLAKSKYTGNMKQFRSDIAVTIISNIFREKINIGDFSTRESSDTSLNNLLKTKKQNLFDYADAFIRYINATSLTAFDTKQNRIIISNFRKEEVDFILKHTDRNPIIFKSSADFKNYLFATDNVMLFGDNKKNLIAKYKSYLDTKEINSLDIETLKDRIEEFEERLREENSSKIASDLKSYSKFEDILHTYDAIKSRDVIDPPLYFEWNTWRAFEMINYALKVKGFFQSDINGYPISVAPGNTPDLIIEYDDFFLMVEVTLSSGNTQFRMECEAVARHYGVLKKSSSKPVYCLFIAPKISESILAHIYVSNKTNTVYYGGCTNIIPIHLEQFTRLLHNAKSCKFDNSKKLLRLLTGFMSKHSNSSSESQWQESIGLLIDTWLKSA